MADSICRICNNPHTKKILSIPYASPIGYDCSDYIQEIYCCENCGYVGTANPINVSLSENNYKNLAKYEGSVCADKEIENFSERKSYVSIAGFQHSFLSSYLTEINSILDIGASTGYALSLYQADKKLGIDPSPRNSVIGRKHYKVEMYTGLFEQWHESFPDEKYDLVFMSHVLEHLNDPKGCIELLDSHVSRYVFIEVPTLDLRYRNRPYGLFSEEHISYFSVSSLIALMKGYELVSSCINLNPSIDEAVGYPSILTLWKKSTVPAGTDTSKNLTCLYSSCEIITRYVQDSAEGAKLIKEKILSLSDKGTVSIWGAGSHTFKLLADDEIYSRINWNNIYDNNPQKWGHKIRDIGVCKFEHGKNSTDEFILVSSNTAQEEIVSGLRRLGFDDKYIITLY